MEASHPEQENRDTPAVAARGGGGIGALRQLIELKDRRLQAAAFFLAWGFSMVIYVPVLNRSARANPEHLLAGFVLFTIGVALALLTLGGGGRLAARVEGFLRGFF